MIKDLLKQPKAIVLFSAPHCNGCGPVDMIVRELMKVYKDIPYTKVDNSTKEGGKLATKYGVRSIPLLMFFEYGSPVHVITGQKQRIDYEFKIKKFALKKQRTQRG